MGQIALNFVVAHQQYFLGIASGYAIAHIPAAVLVVFHLAMKIPWLRSAVVNNPAQAKQIIDSIQKAIDDDIDAEAAAAKAPSASPPAP